MNEAEIKQWVYDRQMRLKKIIDVELHQAELIKTFNKDINSNSG